TGTPNTYTITVNPTPTANVPANATYCPGNAVPAGNFTSNPAGGTFAWTNSNTSIGLAASGTGNQPAFTATNATGTAISGTITVTPTVNGCTGTPSTYTITINPNPTATVPANFAVCDGQAVAASSYTSTPAGATYTWTNSNTSIGLGASGAGNTPGFTATNGGGAPITGTITVTPTLAGCTGAPSTYTITVNTLFDATITPAGPFCANATSVTLTAASPGGTWSGTGITNASAGTFDPATAGAGTFTITYTIPGACGNTDTENITVNAVPTVTVPANITVCNGGNVTASAFTSNPAGGTFAWTNSDPTIGLAANGTGNTPAFTATNGGSASVTSTINVTPTANGCAGTPSSYTITVNPTPTVTVPANSTVCNGVSVPAGNFTSTPAGGTFAWTNSNTAIGLGASGTGNQPSFTGTNGTGASISGTITVTPTANGCTGTPSSYTITVDPTPTVTVPANSTVCNGTAVAAGNFTSTPAGGTFAWTNSDPSIGLAASGTGNQPAFTATNGGSTSVTATITVTPTANGCTGTPSSYTITINPTPTVTVPANSSWCDGVTVAASAYTSTPAGGTFTWTNSNTAIGLGASGTGNQPAFTATNGTGSPISGTITVTPTVNGCTGTPSSYTLTITTLLDATITPAGPFCESASSVTLSAADPGGTWSGNGITNTSSGTFDPVTAGVGTHTITYMISSFCGDTATTTIQVLQDMDATITPAGPFCDNDPALNLTAVDPGGTWSGTGITDAVNGTFDPAVAGQGTFTITYSISGQCGDTQTTSITINVDLDATINPAGPFCASNPNTFLAAATTGGIWSGPGIVNATTGEFSPTTAGAGNHVITYMLTGSCGDTATLTIQVFADADATISPAGPFCITDPALNLSAAQAGGVWSGNGITNAATGTFNPSTAGAGTHLITYSISGVCGDIDTEEIIVTDLIPSTITPAGPFCVNAAPVTLTAASPGGTWSGQGITNPATGAFDPSAAGAGTWTITYTITGSCGTTSTTNITVNPLPVVSFTGDVLSGCVPVTTTFTNTTASTGTATWLIDGVNASNSTTTFTNSFTAAGCYDITLQVTSAAGCTNSATQADMVCAFAYPVAGFSFTPVDATVLDPTINFINESQGATSYTWDFAGLGTSTQVNPSFTFPNTGAGSYEVCLGVSNAQGCMDSVCQFVLIYDEFLVYVPNAFTVDGDGVNDVFMPVVSGHDPLSYELMIFNRWGELIFESHFNQVGWDGTYKSLPAKQDVYVWKLKVKRQNNGEQKEFYGHVTLLR
ncbi:MAG: PKD-like domain-containing protein, partial [Bacteroidota bacterium]